MVTAKLASFGVSCKRDRGVQAETFQSHGRSSVLASLILVRCSLKRSTNSFDFGTKQQLKEG